MEKFSLVGDTDVGKSHMLHSVLNYFFDYTWIYSKKMVWNSLKKQLYSTSYTTVEHQNYVIKTKNVRYDVENAKLYLADYPNINIRLHHD